MYIISRRPLSLNIQEPFIGCALSILEAYTPQLDFNGGQKRELEKEGTEPPEHIRGSYRVVMHASFATVHGV